MSDALLALAREFVTWATTNPQGTPVLVAMISGTSVVLAAAISRKR